MTHRELCEAGAKWLTKVQNWNYRCAYAAVELCSVANENPDVLGLNGSNPIMLEVKMSKSDFKADLKKPHRSRKGIGATRYYLCPEGLIKPDEVNNGFGLIYYADGKFKVVKDSKYFEDRDFHSELLLMMSIIRRLQGTKKVIDFRKKTV